ncbi:MAG: hypothetical protein UU47_C0015G0018 [candidate division TM6 bacterium GW2011_GWE2_41_16]|nr:MAG: hypothetical protein UU47_C0015G0018 [candidate division TM6 bacterium GW2011_GWE2_41_16]
MEHNPFDAFIALVEFDAHITMLEHKRDTASKNQQKKQIAQQKASALLDELRAQLKRMQLDIKTQEADLAHLEKTIATKERAKNLLQSSKEIIALEREIKKLEEQRDASETRIIEMLETAEKAHLAFEQQQKSFDDQNISETKEIALLTDEIHALETEIIRYNQQRTIQLSSIEKSFLDEYEHMRKKIKNPVVPVEKDVCTACFYVLNESEKNALVHKRRLLCRGCYRLLYRTF